MPFPHKAFGKDVDPVAAAKKGAAMRGERYKFLRQNRCNNTCPYYYKGCIYISLSKTPKYAGKCAVKNLPEKQYERVVRFLEGKAEDYVANMVELYMEMENSVKLRKDPQMMMQCFDRLQRMFVLMHGDNRQTETGIDMRQLYDEMTDQLSEMEKQVKKDMKNAKDKKEKDAKDDTSKVKSSSKKSTKKT